MRPLSRAAPQSCAGVAGRAPRGALTYYPRRVIVSGRWWRQLRARSAAQLTVTALLVCVAVAGVVCTVAGDRVAGRVLIGLVVVSLWPLLLWLRSTELPGD